MIFVLSYCALVRLDDSRAKFQFLYYCSSCPQGFSYEVFDERALIEGDVFRRRDWLWRYLLSLHFLRLLTVYRGIQLTTKHEHGRWFPCRPTGEKADRGELFKQKTSK